MLFSMKRVPSILSNTKPKEKAVIQQSPISNFSETLKTYFAPRLINSDTYVQVQPEKKIDTPIKFTSNNHALWLGKFPNSMKKRKGKEGIYSKTLFQAGLTYLKQHITNHEDCVVIISSSLSEIMNGKDDVKGSLTEEEAKLTLKTLWKNIGKDPKSLTVHTLEELHPHLFSELRKHSTNTGTDLFAVFAGDPPETLSISDDNLSFKIAHLLFHATQQDLFFQGLFTNMVPEKIKHDLGPLLEQSSSGYYGLIEIACRLAEIAQGRIYNGGADRQKRYDNIITAILSRSNQKKWNTAYKMLSPIRDLIENYSTSNIRKDFYILEKENPYEKKHNLITKTTRIALTSLLGGTLLTGVYFQGRKDAITEESKLSTAMMDDAINKYKYAHISASGFTYASDISFAIKSIEVENLTKQMVQECIAIYHIQKSQRETASMLLDAMIRQYIQRYPILSAVMKDTTSSRHSHLFKIIEENRTTFLNHNIYLENPFESFLPYLDEIIHIDYKKETEIPNTSSEIQNRGLKLIGQFIKGDENHSISTTIDGKTIYKEIHKFRKNNLYRDKTGKYYSSLEEDDSLLTTLSTIFVFDYLIDDINAYDLRFFTKEMESQMVDFQSKAEDLPQIKKTWKDMQYYNNKIISFNDTFGTFSYELAFYEYYDEKKSPNRVLLSRKKGESEFQLKLTLEVYKQYMKHNSTRVSYYGP